MTGAIRIGTRGSALALAQAHIVGTALEQAGNRIALIVIETEGDRRSPDTAWGEGAFVAALEQALLDGEVDAAVHSAKDIPTDEDGRLRVAAYLPREDARDALVMRDQASGGLGDVPVGARVGTDSPRRAGFLRARRPDLQLHPLHGNVDTRLRRLDAGETDALILAVAGLARLQRSDRIAERFDPAIVPPAPGQGALAVQVRTGDTHTRDAVEQLDDRATRLAVESERAFLAASGGGCRAPVGAFATLVGTELVLLGGYARADGSATAVDLVRGGHGDGVALGRELAARLDRRLPRIAADAGAARPSVLVTRARAQSRPLLEALRGHGLDPVAVPAIDIVAAPAELLDDAVRRLGTFRWTVATSGNGADALIAAAHRCSRSLDETRWAAVGSATAAVLHRAGVDEIFRPRRTGGRSLGVELPVEPGDRVLLARGDLADGALPRALRDRGALVEEVVAYRTVEAPSSSGPLLERALQEQRIAAVLFTSGSTVRGLVGLAGAEYREAVLAMPAICIGPETAQEARRHGYAVVAEAPMQATETLAETAARVVSGRARATP